MSLILTGGQTVRAENARLNCVVGGLLGAGGQGEVYQADLEGHPVALKWYYASTATERQRALLEALVRKGAPASRFLWPTDLAYALGVPGFGYIMPLREPRFRPIADLMKRRIEPSFKSLATAGFELAHSFLQLHSRGLCYRDISFGNLFFDPATGEIAICDNDNVTVDGDGSPGILGTPRFMAPEVVRGEALPGTETDLFSLAVLLFYLLMVHHPLEGAREDGIHCFDLAAMTRLYGSEPVFIFHSTDTSNPPLPGRHDNALAFWPIYPQAIRDLFTRAFTDGLHPAPGARVREGEWRAAMVRLRDSVFACGNCSAENFYVPDAVRTGAVCWSCHAPLALPPRIRTGRSVVVLTDGTKLFPHHLDDTRPYDFTEPLASVVPHPSNPAVRGLCNLSNETWRFHSPDNAQQGYVATGRTVRLANGLRIHFGKVEGEVRV